MSTDTHDNWQWPGVGPSPVSYGMDTEIFDSEKFPHVQTFVREAIQNSLDARFDKTAPVRVRFRFGQNKSAFGRNVIADLQGKKKACGLGWPEDWSSGSISWLLVEDTNSSGLNGDLGKRSSDFWNYWLNFGISNKNGSGRGGRGIGRVTFLIASGISTVIGLTRRASDGKVAACGMSVLKPGEYGSTFKSSYAYLARCEAGDIYELYDDAEFISGLIETFGTTDYRVNGMNGLSLIIPFPHETLSPDALVAAAIEHFAPAIIEKFLVVEVNDETVDHASIDDQARRVSKSFPPGPLNDDPIRVLDLERASVGKHDHAVKVASPSGKLADHLSEEDRNNLRAAFESEGRLSLAIDVPVVRHGKKHESRICVALARTPKGGKPVDLFFREGMCLPSVTARHPADVDVVVQANDGELVSYLNFCEGKAHLDLIQNKEVTAKLIENGFEGHSLRRFVRGLMEDVRALVLPDTTKPDATIFSGFFSIPKPGKKEKGKGAPILKDVQPPEPPTPPPPAKPRVFIIDDLPDGFRVRANPQHADWPVNLTAEIAYADGSGRPGWSKHDFELQKLPRQHVGSKSPEFGKNKFVCRDCGSDFSIEFTGFDGRRELVTNVRPFRNA